MAFAFALSGLTACSGGGGGGGDDSVDSSDLSVQVEPVLTGLQYPGSFEFAPDGRLFFSEIYAGRVRVASGGTVQTSPVVRLDGPPGDEVILGIALDPDFNSNHQLYLFNTTTNPTRSRVVRYREGNGAASDPAVLIDGLPQGGHDGGILRFADDGTLFVSVGDAGEPDIAPDQGQLGGKILRLNTDGSVPGDNPIPGSPIFALGFRNVFGMALNPQSGKLFVSDNGPECNDEINLVVSGGNYGWRDGQPCEDDRAEHVIAPIITINPPVGITGTMFYNGSMFPEFSGNLIVGDINNGQLRRYGVNGDTGEAGAESILLDGGYGGIVGVGNGPDGAIYFSTADAIYKITRN
jgi:glucose/arabinose dehydrogenase